MSSRHIIFVNRFFHPDRSATSQILSDLAFHLARRGNSVTVVTTRGRYDDVDADLPPFERISGVEIRRVYRPRFARGALLGRAIDYLGMYVCFAAAVWRLSKRGDRLIVKTDPPLLSVALTPTAKLKGLMQVNWLQDLYPEVALDLGLSFLAPVAPLLIAARNASLRAAKQNVVISRRMRERVEAGGVAPAHIATIANWCDDETLTPRARDDNPLRLAWALADKFVVGYSGNLGRAHEYETLLEAADQLRAYKDIVFLFIGGGHSTPSLKRAVANRGLNEAFRFLPYQEASVLPQSLAASDVHWLSMPPAMEGLIFPSKLYGIAAAGRPIVAISDPEGEVAGLVERHDCGFAIAPGESAHLAKTILTLRGDRALCERLGRNARRMLEASFSRREALARWARLIDQL